VPYEDEITGKVTDDWHQVSKVQYLYAMYLIGLKGQRQNGCMLTVPYFSVWDEGAAVESTASVNTTTGEVTDAVAPDKIAGPVVCKREYITLNGAEVTVYKNEHGYDLWADIANERGDDYLAEVAERRMRK
jgi:hypothetical protein